uniref:DDE-1 domain-containing protein n=1 Tax=Sparus aurata TaxID=8175 RepID=A0A671Y3U3_SPAAU
MAPAVAPKRQRKMLTIAQKVGLLDMLKEGKSYAAVGRHYGINESSVRYKKKEENNIRTTAAISFNKDAKRVVTVRNKTIVRMESEQDDADPRPLTSTFHAEPSPFNASKGWSEKFQKPFGLKSVSLQGEATSADTAGAEAYVNNKFKVIIEEGGYKPEQVFNMDVTGLFWKRMPSRTFIMQDEAKAPGFKAQKDRVTLVMCGNANALPVYWMHNAKAWMTKALNLDWFKQCFIPQVKRYLRGKGLDFKVLLLVDNAGGHADDLSYDGVQIEFLPPNTTSLIQPMDQGIIRAFKALYTRNTLQHLVAAMDSYQDFSLQAYWREDTIASCLQNIQRAIQEMKTETLNACWKKLWPKAVHNPTGCSLDEIHHSAVDAAVNLARQLGGDGFNDMTPDDINALVDAHSQPLTDDDLAEMTKPPSEYEEEEEEENASVDKDEEDELTLDRLATMVRMANELQRAAQEWDPLMFRSLQFSNIIEGGMSVYKNLLAQKKKERQQLPITMFFTRKKTPAPTPSVGKDATVERRQDEE